ncbi:hypothetical protein D3C76_1098910 [compost metagenome]
MAWAASNAFTSGADAPRGKPITVHVLTLELVSPFSASDAVLTQTGFTHTEAN